MEKAAEQFGSIEATRRLDDFFGRQLALVARLRDASRSRNEIRWSVVYPLLYAIVDSGGSLRTLAQQVKVRDCYVLSRVIFETVVNTLFILAQGNVAADRALRHTRQKSIRDFDRTNKVSKQSLKIRWGGADAVTRDPEVQKLLKEFTTKKGRELTSWTDESIAGRIETVEAHFGQKVSRGLAFGLTLFRHASEIAHGTLFGALFSLGLTSPAGPAGSPTDLEQHFREHLSMLFLLLGLCFNSLILAAAPELGKSTLVKLSQSLVSKAQAEPWVAAKDDP